MRAVERTGVPRTYRSVRRETQARLTRQRILEAATALFLGRAYAGTTMRTVAREAGVSVPTVEALFGTKSRLLKAAIDVAIVGDDEEVPVLGRAWTTTALAADSSLELLSIVAGVVGPAQGRSAGLVLAAFEGASTDSDLAELSDQMTSQRATTAEWIVDALTRTFPLRSGCNRQEAVDTVWILMDPAVFDRLVRQRGWTTRQYETWFARSLDRLLVADDTERPPAPRPTPRPTRSSS